MALDEQILIRMGLDQRPLAMGLRTASQKTQSWADSEGKKFGKFFTGSFAGMFKTISLAGIVMGLRSTSEEINSLKDNTEELEKRFGKLGEANIQAASDIAGGFAMMEKFGKRASITLAASFSTLFEVLASKVSSNMSIAEILDDMAEQSIRSSREGMRGKSEKRLQDLIGRYRELRQEMNFGLMSNSEKVDDLNRQYDENLKLINDQNTAAERQVELATANLKIQQQLSALLSKPPEEDWSNMNAVAIGEWNPTKMGIIRKPSPVSSSIRESMREQQAALRAQMAERFGDPSQPGYRDPAAKAAAALTEQLAGAIAPNGALRVTPD